MKNLILLLITVLPTLPGLAQGSDSASYFYNRGLAEKEARRYREAENNFAKAHQLAPDNINYLLDYADALLEQHRYTDAIDKFEKAEKIDSNNTRVIENMATLSVNMRNWEKGIQYAQKLKKIDPAKNVDLIIARCYYNMEYYADAIKFCELAFKKEPNRAEIPYIAGRSFMEMHNYKRAAGCYDQALGLDSSNANWMYEAGLVWYAVPDDKKSLYWIKRAGDKGYPKTNDYMENLASAYMNSGDYPKGVEILKSVLERKPQDQEILYSIADAYYRTKNYQDAIDFWDRVLEIDKKNANALYMIGMAYQKKGEKEKGMQLCDKAIEMDPSLKNLKQERKMPGGL